MFELDWGKLVVIGIVALIVIGPKELPTVLRTLGQYMAKIRRMASEFQGQFQDALREAEVSDLKKQAEEMHASVSDITNFDPMANVKTETEAALNPQPATAAEPSPTATVGAPEAPPLPEIDVPLPPMPKPLTNEDFAPLEPPKDTAKVVATDAVQETAKEPEKQSGSGA